MSDTPETPATPPSGGPARPTPPPVSPPQRSLRLDPAAAMIGIGGVVLLLALWWLWATPRASQSAAADEARLARIEERLDSLTEQTAGLVPRVQSLAGLEQRLSQLAEVEGRLRAMEQRPAPPDIRPLEQQVSGLVERLNAAERRIQAAENRPAPPDIHPLEQQIAAAERRLQALEGRPAFDPAAVPTRQSVEQLSGRLAQVAERVEAVGARQQEIARAAEQRATEVQQMAQQRMATAEQAMEQRLGTLQQQLGQRIAAVEEAQQRLSATASQATRLAALDAVRAALAGGQPLGPTLQRLDNPPQALARFAQSAPPTEASLRLSFEDAVRAARAVSDPAVSPGGEPGGVAESALARLGGLVTIRRGEQVVWGDAIEQPIERARRALEAGDLEQAVQHLEKLPPEPRQAMKGWIDQAQALLAARTALRQMAAG